MELSTVIIAFIVGTLYMFYKNRRVRMSVFRPMGVPGPEPHWLTGNLRELQKQNSFESYLKWEAQYGKTFGYYEGPLPILVTSDPTIIKEVFVKQFSKFHGKKPFPLFPDPDNFPDVNMLLARGHRWKRLRSIINPTYSTHKLKQILPAMHKKIDVLVDKLSEAEQTNKPVETTDVYAKMAIDVIGETAFGLDLNAQNNPDEPFYTAARGIFAMSHKDKTPWISKLAVIVPEIETYIAGILTTLMTKFKVGPFMWIKGTMDDVLKQRRQEKQPRTDLLQLMLDAEAPEAEVVDVNMWEMKADDAETDGKQTDEAPSAGELKRSFSSTKSNRKLTNAEICNQSTVILMAGTESTSTVLSYLCYLLALNPDVQDKLLEEVDKYKDVDVSEAANKMKYLDMCIKETLRLYPVGTPFMHRLCMEPAHVCGYDIPAGVVVQANSMSLHYDPELWGPVDTKVFYPERFLPEHVAHRPDMAWIPFGAGPRNCLGMRFALLEARHTMVKVLRRLRFDTCPETQIPLRLREGVVIAPADGIALKVVARN